MATQTVQQLQAQIPALQKAVDDAAAALNSAVSERDRWKNEAESCDARRSQFSVSWKKDQACSLANRDLYYANWDKYSKLITTCTNSYNLAKSKLDNLNAQINKVQQQDQQQLLSDPNYALQYQQQQSQAANETKKIEEAEKTKRMYFMIGGIVAGLAALFGGIALIIRFKNSQSQ